MNSYIVNFAVYSFAMVGFFLTILFVYKKSINPMGVNNNKEFLKVENALKLSPVKTIYVIKAGNEKFLIAGDTANTTMLAKLENNQNEQEIIKTEKTERISPFTLLNKIKDNSKKKMKENLFQTIIK